MVRAARGRLRSRDCRETIYGVGLRDRLNAARTYMKSPLSLSMLERGSDLRVHVGRTAKVVVEVEGVDDGTVQRIELMLRRSSASGGGSWVDLPLGEVPATAGRHELTVTIPVGIIPSSIGFGNYQFRGHLVRSKGVESDAVSPVVVVGRAEDLHWPDGPRSGGTAQPEVRLTVAVDHATADIGSTVGGRVSVQALGDLPAEAVELEFGAEVDALVKAAGHNALQQRSRFKAVATLTLAPKAALAAGQQLDLPFRVEIPAGLPPTLRDGTSSVVWQARVRRGGASAWATVGVLDPNSLSAPSKERPAGLTTDLLTREPARFMRRRRRAPAESSRGSAGPARFAGVLTAWRCRTCPASGARRTSARDRRPHRR